MDKVEVAIEFLKMLELFESKFFYHSDEPEGAVGTLPFKETVIMGNSLCRIEFRATITVIINRPPRAQ